ncbi:MAG TPA: MaoC/PaaZ C-terminal domain-containing protein [Patescibacteria group bacterium]|jgi:acyl dehydratase|nr:MaoC/PaaZ C-terminal domain-containing protein [Patescibacteria group bacterium]
MPRNAALASPPAAGVFFEDLSIGQFMESGLSQITQPEIDAFAELSHDRNPLHTSLEFAREHGHASTLAHGALVFSRATGLAYELGLFVKASAYFKLATLDFTKKVYAGDSVRIKMEIKELKALPRMKLGKVIVEVKVLNQGNELVQDDVWTALVAMRNH